MDDIKTKETVEGEERRLASWARLSHEQSPFSEMNLGNVNTLGGSQKQRGGNSAQESKPSSLAKPRMGFVPAQVL